MNQNTLHVVVMGVGDIGSRHLQSLAKSAQPLSIYAVDPSEDAANVAKQRFCEIEGYELHEYHQLRVAEALPSQVDLAIIATTAKHRAQAVKQLLSQSNVAYMILEKILFVDDSDYEHIGSLLRDKQVKCWVNHPRRCFPFYQALKQRINASSKVSMIIHGGGWGLGSNGLHFVDLLSYFVGQTNIAFNTCSLDKALYDYKRVGYKEIYGVFTAEIGQHRLVMHCENYTSPWAISIETDTLSLRIDEESETFIEMEKQKGWKAEFSHPKMTDYQSNMTHQIMQDLMQNGTCDLTSFDDAVALHQPFVHAMKRFFTEECGLDQSAFPIT